MDYASAATRTVDPYRAGSALGETLAPQRPDLVLLFFTIHYLEGIPDLVAGLRDALGPAPLLCGGTGDGVYSPDGVFPHGVAALGIRGDGRARFAVGWAEGVGEAPERAAEEAARAALDSLGAPPTFAFALSDGGVTDGVRFVEGLVASLPCPFFGGLTGDDRRFRQGAVLVAGEARVNACLVLAAAGDLPLRVGVASGFRPFGDAGRVTDADGYVIRAIDGLPAGAFFRDRTGRIPTEGDLGTVPLAVIDAQENFVLRALSRANHADGSIKLFGRITPGAAVKVCHATEDDLVRGVDQALDAVLGRGDFRPGAAIVVSCAGRKWLLSESGEEEIRRLHETLGALPFAGFPSFGEIAPPLGAEAPAPAPVRFHNVTFVVAALGL